MIAGLYAITNESLMLNDNFAAKAEAVLLGGCKVIQYRNKNLPLEKKVLQGTILRHLCDQHNALLIINDSTELALLVKADGVHLGQDDEPVDKARKKLGAKAVIGVTCHDSLALAKDAARGGASYVAFGRFFPSKTKPNASTAPLSLIQRARCQLSVPIVAIGGINSDNAPQLIEAGSDSIAVSDDIFSRSIQNNLNVDTSKQNTITEQAKLYCSLFKQT